MRQKSGFTLRRGMAEQKRGFTLIELLVVISIIVIIAGLVIFTINEARDRARSAKTLSNTDTIVAAAEMYYDAYGKYPDDGWGGVLSTRPYYGLSNT